MNRPNRLTVIAGAVGGLALVATAVGAVALSDGTSETPGSSATQSAAPLDPATGGPSDDRDSDDGAGTGSSATDSGISRDEAVAIAEQALADRGPVPPFDEIEREFEHGQEVWKVEFGDDHEAYVDIATGEVVKLEVDDDRDGDRDDDFHDDQHDLDDDDGDDDRDDDRHDD